MSNLNTYFKKAVSVLKKGFAYVMVIPVLIKAVYHRLVGNGYYEVAFTKIGRKWYCEVPNFPKELFEHTLMVGGASKFLDYHAKENKKVVITIKVTDKENGNMRLVKNSSTGTLLSSHIFGSYYSFTENQKYFQKPSFSLKDTYSQ